MKMTYLEKSGFTRLLLLTNMLQSVEIKTMIVPELVEIGSNVVLDCPFKIRGDQFDVFWYFNDVAEPIYEWNPRSGPRARGIFKEKLNISAVTTAEGHALNIVNVTLDLSGNYTCMIVNHGEEVRQTGTMFVYSPEQQFDLNFIEHDNEVEITCNIRGIYPKPELTVECNNGVITRQQQRVWRNEGSCYDAKCTAQLSKTAFCVGAYIVCRLQLCQVDYTAIKKRFLRTAGPNCNSSSRSMCSLSTLLNMIVYLVIFKLI